MSVLERMMKRQDEVNTVAMGEAWSEMGLDWRLAITQETAELIDSFDWKWWKHMKVDMENAKIEIVDIWHFLLSIMIEEGVKPDEMLEEKFSALTKTGAVSITSNKKDILRHLKNITKTAASDRSSLEIADAVLMAAGKIGMTFEDITKLYMGKAVLNNFRQMHGYSDGSYKKIWDGKEDNEVMFEIISTLPYNESFESSLEMALTERYLIVE
jgi:dimeric dUTPase (all-alpha-NTP-PPase superfamily)